jgi:REP element-mobilizing transposase RayT
MPIASFYRRNLPHWRVLGSCYFVTFRLHDRQVELRFEERTLVEKTLLRAEIQGCELDAYVVMNDHVHVLVRPAAARRLEDLVQAWKSASAHLIKRSSDRQGAIWQREYFDRIVRNDREWLEKITYIAGNPGKRWPGIVGYRWVRPRPDDG